jgi:hypothetical protein
VRLVLRVEATVGKAKRKGERDDSMRSKEGGSPGKLMASCSREITVDRYEESALEIALAHARSKAPPRAEATKRFKASYCLPTEAVRAAAAASEGSSTPFTGARSPSSVKSKRPPTCPTSASRTSRTTSAIFGALNGSLARSSRDHSRSIHTFSFKTCLIETWIAQKTSL